MQSWTQRYLDKIEAFGPDKCWLWQAGKDGSGYGCFWLNEKLMKAHRIAWELENGSIPEDKVVSHICGNRDCCNPTHLILREPSPTTRNWQKRYEENLYVGAPDMCWEYALTDSDGYGRILVEGKRIGAHRLAWEIENGPIPDGMCICHHCDNPSCCNPAHLFLGTHTDNAHDRDKKGRGGSARGSKVGGAKLTSDDVRKIRALYSTGKYTQRLLAGQFGVASNTVCYIVNRKLWTWLE